MAYAVRRLSDIPRPPGGPLKCCPLLAARTWSLSHAPLPRAPSLTPLFPFKVIQADSRSRNFLVPGGRGIRENSEPTPSPSVNAAKIQASNYKPVGCIINHANSVKARQGMGLEDSRVVGQVPQPGRRQSVVSNRPLSKSVKASQSEPWFRKYLTHSVVLC